MRKKIVDLPEPEFRKRMLAAAMRVFELSEHFAMREEDGYSPGEMSSQEILEEACEALSFFECDGTAAEECERGDKQALQERREMRAFVRVWKVRLQQRKAIR